MKKRRQIPAKDLIPSDIISEILVRIPAKDLFPFKFVCKHWFSIISSKNFIKAHLARITRAPPEIILPFRPRRRDPTEFLSINLQDLSLLEQPPFLSLEEELDEKVKSLGNSCNGLILIRDPLSVYNPITREYEWFNLPEKHASDFDLALVYDKTIDKYKIFGMFDDCRQCLVLTLGNPSDEWRELTSITKHIPNPPPCVCPHFLFVETELHWVAVDIAEEEVYVFSVDVANENITNINKSPKPKDFVEFMDTKYCLSEVKGSLCLTMVQHHYLEIWVLKGNTWFEAYSIDVGSLPNKPPFLDSFLNRNTDVVLMPRSDSDDILDILKIFIHREDQLFHYQLKDGELKQIGILRGIRWLEYLCVHFNSLVTWK